LIQYRPPPPPPKGSLSKLEYELTTTGKERREYEAWKKEQVQIDAERLQRQKDEMGRWKREWDQHKPLDR